MGEVQEGLWGLWRSRPRTTRTGRMTYKSRIVRSGMIALACDHPPFVRHYLPPPLCEIPEGLAFASTLGGGGQTDHGSVEGLLRQG